MRRRLLFIVAGMIFSPMFFSSLCLGAELYPFPLKQRSPGPGETNTWSQSPDNRQVTDPSRSAVPTTAGQVKKFKEDIEQLDLNQLRSLKTALKKKLAVAELKEDSYRANYYSRLIVLVDRRIKEVFR